MILTEIVPTREITTTTEKIFHIFSSVAVGTVRQVDYKLEGE